MNICKRKLGPLVDSLGNFLKAFDQTSKVIQIPLPTPKAEFGSTISKNYLFTQYPKGSIEPSITQLPLSFRLRNNKTCVFSIKKFDKHGKNFILTENVNLCHREIQHLHKNPNNAGNKCKITESNYDCSTFTTDCRYNKSFVKLFGNGFCLNTIDSVMLCMHKKLFIFSVEPTINAFIACPCVRCGTFFLKNKQIRFS